jgi:hypothetical protein
VPIFTLATLHQKVLLLYLLERIAEKNIHFVDNQTKNKYAHSYGNSVTTAVDCPRQGRSAECFKVGSTGITDAAKARLIVREALSRIMNGKRR